jgi:hypothetical protein
MKKILIPALVFLILIISNQLKAQYPKLEIKATFVKESQAGKGDAEIHLSTEGEKPPYIFQIFDKAPWDGGKELANSKKIYKSQYIFRNLTTGTYFVCVTDNEENSDCDIIQISND